MMQYFSNGLGNQPTIQDHSFTNCALSFLIYEVILCQFVCHWSLGVSDPIRLVFWEFEKKHHFPKIKRKVVVLEGNEEGIY